MRFIVRQPVFDGQEAVAAYWLNVERRPEDAAATVEAVQVALERIAPPVKAIVECGEELLASPLLQRLPPARLILALDAEGQSLESLKTLAQSVRQAGYGIAVLGHPAEVNWEPLLPLIDWYGASSADSAALAGLRAGKVALLARNIATREERTRAFEAGFRYFVGPYYLTPAQELQREVPASKLACLQLLTELQRPVLNHYALEEIIKTEASFCYRLMRYMNSAAFFGIQRVTSIRHAMGLLGDDQLRRWLSMMATVAAAEGRPSEMVITAMLRARLCELLAPEDPDGGYMVGLFSLMPLVVNMQLAALLSVIRLPPAVDRTLWGDPGTLRTLLDLAVAYERAQWQVVRDLAESLKLTDEQISNARSEASRWVNAILSHANLGTARATKVR